MPANVKAIPDGYSNVTPYLVIKGAANAIEFYKSVFGATERFRMPMPGDRIGHAELQIGDSVIMLADECNEMATRNPLAIGGTPVSIHLYVKDVDNVVNSAKTHGAQVIREVANQFYGDRSGTIKDPFGHIWNISTHVEDVSPEEMQKRMAALPR